MSRGFNTYNERGRSGSTQSRGGPRKPQYHSNPGGATSGSRPGAPKPSGFSGGASRSRFGGGSNRSGGGFKRREGGFNRGGFGGGSRSGGFGGGRSGGGRGRGAMKQIDVRKLIAQHATVKYEHVEQKITHKFTDFKLAPQIEKNIQAKGYVDPTPIQDQVIPIVMDGKDVVGIANTGTGKSAAFLLPLLNKMVSNKSLKVLVILPTRELANQLHAELRSYAQGMQLNAVTCVGGMSINVQIRDLHRPFNFVFGTPGRLKDLVNRRELNLNQFNTIVLDEVDRMLDMGFITDIEYLVTKLPEKRHSLFFSATLTDAVEKVMHRFVKEYVKVSVKTGETSANVKQEVVDVTSTEDKINKLVEIIDHHEFNKAIVFVRTKHGADRLHRELQKRKHLVDVIHGNKRQAQRDRTIKAFKSGQYNVLIATDVAARGLDIPDVSHVINYDAPGTADDYVHRIGRTGRSGKKGVAITFVEKAGHSEPRD